MSPRAASLEALLASVIDYAGLFPPAKLDMKSTVEHYARYLQSDESWMLGRLIVPVARLQEFEECSRGLLPGNDQSEAEPWLISALVSPAENAEQLAADLAAIDAFNRRHSENNGDALIDMIELKAESAAAIDKAIDQIGDDLFPFFELPIQRDPRGLIAALADGDAGAKVRTGGIEAAAYPNAEDLARFISACAAAHVPFKATAGLHHPLRHFSSAVNTFEFGFLNVFTAAVLAGAQKVDSNLMRELLEDQSFGNFFFFDDRGLAWRGRRIDTEEIEWLRDELAVSFGSCSFEEPVDDLRQLKLI